MLFDGFTVCAQLVNFLLLVWLLKRYLYRPILDAVEAREKLIATQLSEAETQKVAALQERRQLEVQNEQFAEQRESLLRTATGEVERERLKMLADARSEADVLRAGFATKLASDRLAWEREFVERTRHEVFAIARRALQDLADASLEAQIVRGLVKKVQELSADDKGDLQKQPHQSDHPIIVRSSLELGSQPREQIQTVLASIGQADRAVKFETTADLVCGVEILVNGHKVAWSVSDYLAQAEAALQQVSSISSAQANQHVVAIAN